MISLFMLKSVWLQREQMNRDYVGDWRVKKKTEMHNGEREMTTVSSRHFLSVVGKHFISADSDLKGQMESVLMCVNACLRHCQGFLL